MSDPNFVPVSTSLVRQTIVEALHEKVETRRAAGEPEAPPPALEGAQSLAGDNEPALDRALRRAGYVARVVEVEMFEPAQRPAPWVAEMIADRLARAGDDDRDAAIAALCGELARAEPVEKPERDDPAAMSWQVPGPGGHVRHYAARRMIEQLLREREDPVEGDPAELKRPWMYGFFVRTCEEALSTQDAPAPDAADEGAPAPDATRPPTEAAGDDAPTSGAG